MGTGDITIHPQNNVVIKDFSSKDNSLNETPLVPFKQTRSQQKMQVSPSKDVNQKRQLKPAAQLLSKLNEEYFSSLLKQSGSISQFFTCIEQETMQFYLSLSKQTLDGMLSKQLINYEGKLKIAEAILILNIRLLKVIGKHQNFKFQIKNFIGLNNYQKDILQFMKVKYPRNNQYFVPGQLLKTFSQFNHLQRLEHDIIRGSGCRFKSIQEKQLLKEIKIFLNKIMNQLDQSFPSFYQMLQQKLFVISDNKNLNYKIGRKLPQNIARFTDLDSKSLDIKSPQLFRVIVKWVEGMEELILHPDTIHQRQSFKTVVNIENEILYDEIIVQNSGSIITDLSNKLTISKESYQNDMKQIMQKMHSFNNNLIKVLQQTNLQRKYVEKEQAQLIKFSSYQTKFLQWMLAQKLRILLKTLITIQKQFDTQYMIQLDLVQFNVTDLMRAMISGSKKQLLLLFQNIMALSNAGQLTVIKIKNRLSTPMNDAMVLFTMRGSFLICELQLILVQSNEGAQQKFKHIEVLNHFFYQLQRSPYGVLSQVAVLLGYKDSRISFADKINYKSKFTIQQCQQKHPKSLQLIKQQLNPIVCYECCKYYGRLQNQFLAKYCKQCEKISCNQCLFKRNKNLFVQIRKQYFISYVQKQLVRFYSKNRNKKDIQINSNMILDLFEEQITQIKEIGKPKQITPTQLQSYLFSKFYYSIYFYIINYVKNQLIATLYYLNLENREIEICFFPKKDFYKKKTLTLDDNAHFLFFKDSLKKVTFSSKESKKKLMFTLTPVEIDFQNTPFVGLLLKQSGIFVLNIINNGNTKDNNLQNQMNQKKQFKYHSIEQYLSFLPQLKDSKNFLSLSNLGLTEKYLLSFEQIDWRYQVKQLRISNNKIIDITSIFIDLPMLQKLYATNNFLQKIIIKDRLYSLKVLVVSQNRISQIQGFQNLIAIIRLNFCNNKLIEFPKCSLTSLQFLLVSDNCLKNAQILKNDYPRLIQLHLLNSFDENDLEIASQYTILFKSLQMLLVGGLRVKHLIVCSVQLTKISISYCQCQKITLFSEKLIEVKFPNNLLTQFDFLFSLSNRNLQKAQLSSNKVKNLPRIDCPQLKTLNLECNQLSNILALQESKIQNLKELKTSGNPISCYSKFDCPLLQTFAMNQNYLDSINQIADNNLNFLKELYFIGTQKLIKLPAFKMNSLVSLTISASKISDVSQFAFSKLPSIQTIVFQSACIKQFPVFKFQNLISLQVNCCQIDSFEALKLLETPKLSSLYLGNLTRFVLPKAIDNNQQQLENKQINYQDTNKQNFNEELNNAQVNHQQVNNQEVVEQEVQIYVFPQLFLPNLIDLSVYYVPISSIIALKTSKMFLLEEISFRGCQLDSFPTLKMPLLNKLYLNENKIQDLNELFASQFPKITHIDLSSNKITVVNNNLMNNKLNNNLKFISIQTLVLSSNQVIELQLKTVPNLKQLYIDYCKLINFPILIAPLLTLISFNQNPFLSISNLSKCLLPCLESFACYNIDKELCLQKVLPVLSFSSLKEFTLASLNYEDLTNLTKSHLPELQHLNINSNQIKIVPNLSFAKLKDVQLSYNKIQNLASLKDWHLMKLEKLSLNKNLIKNIPPLFMPALIQILIAQNQLESLSFFNQSKLVGFQQIDCSNNSQLIIDNSILFPTNTKNVTANEIKEFNLLSVAKLQHLQKIYAQKNKITFIPKFISKVLFFVSFQQNAIQSIDQFLTGEYSLSYLNFAKNKIKKLAVFNHPNLQNINFQQNQIQDIDQFVNQSILNALQTLILTKNKIKRCLKLNFPKLCYIKLGDNELNEVNFLALIPKELQKYEVVLSNNKIKKMTPMKFKCYDLQLQNNQIQTMQWLLETNLQNLGTLSLKNNLIKTIITFPKNNMALTYLNLANNPINNVQNLFKGEQDDQRYLSLTLTIKEKKARDQIHDKFFKHFPGGSLLFYDQEGNLIQDYQQG